jgi:hypothetical protein
MLSLSPNNNENDASALARNLSSLAGSHVDFSRDLFILNGNDILAGREERFGGKGSVGFSPIRMLSLSISACKLGPFGQGQGPNEEQPGNAINLGPISRRE